MPVLSTRGAASSTGFGLNVIPPYVRNGLVLNLDATDPNSTRENLLLFSEDFSSGNYQKENSITVSTNTTATTDPIGGNTADKIIEATSSGGHRLYQGINSSVNEPYTFSVYLKAAERSNALVLIQDVTGNQRGISVDLSNGTAAVYAQPTSYSIGLVSNGWYRVTVTAPSSGSGTIYPIVYVLQSAGVISYTGNGTSGFYMWGQQFEKSDQASAYIQTTSSAVQRNSIFYNTASSTNMTLLNGPVYSQTRPKSFTFDRVDDYGQTSATLLPTANNSPFTLEAVAMTSTGSSYQTVVGTMGTYSQIGFYSTNFMIGRNGGGGNLLTLGAAAININTWYHIAMTFNGSTAIAYLNGVAVASNVNIGSNGALNGASLLSTYTTGSAAEALNGKIGLARVYGRELASSEIRQNFESCRRIYGI